MTAVTWAPSVAGVGTLGADSGRTDVETIDYSTVPIAADPDPDSSFGVDRVVNIETIDRYLGRKDTAYRDMRMLYDPADFESIGGFSELTRTIEGFRITPFPYFVTMPRLTVENGYDGPCLFSVEWGDDNRSVISAQPNYVESQVILEELFPRHKNLFLMCGGGGYAGMMRAFLLFMGWDASKVFNIGANWDYSGSHSVRLISYGQDGAPTYRTWRADYTLIEFDRLEAVDDDGSNALPDPIARQGLSRPDKPRRGTRECIVA